MAISGLKSYETMTIFTKGFSSKYEVLLEISVKCYKKLVHLLFIASFTKKILQSGVDFLFQNQAGITK